MPAPPEVPCGLLDPHRARLLEKLGVPWGIRDAGKPSFGAATRGADREEMDAAWEAIGASTRLPERLVASENQHVRMHAKRMREATDEASRLDGEITALLSSDETCAHLLMVPGIGPGTARSAL